MGEYILEFRNIEKRFNKNIVLKDINFNLLKGEVHSLIGENGAGKSILMKILMGIVPKDGGEIYLSGSEVVFSSPRQAKANGIGMIYQEIYLFPELNVAQNIFIEHEPKHGNMVDSNEMCSKTEKLLRLMNLNISPHTLVEDLDVPQKQVVQILREVSRDAKIIIMDEPAESFSEQETRNLFKIINDLKKTGVSFIFISHKIDDILRISDRISIIRDGMIIDTMTAKDARHKSIIEKMLGEELSKGYPKLLTPHGKELLKVEDLSCRETLSHVSFNLRKGEIVGLTGLMGSGKTVLARAITGFIKTDSGNVYIGGGKVSIKSPQDAIEAGICYMSDDRCGIGLFAEFGVNMNIALANLKKMLHLLLLDKNLINQNARKYIKQLGIRVANIEERTDYLSGGNQQKVLLAKWLNSDSHIFIMDEPTQGIDIAGKVDVYNIMNELKRKGYGILFISSHVPELIGICDRILIMYNGEIVKNLDTEEATMDTVYLYTAGEFNS